MSHAAAMPVPPPKHAPWTSATVGTAKALSRRTASVVAREARRFSSGDPMRTASIHRRSAPAWKCLPFDQNGADAARSLEGAKRRQQALEQRAIVCVVHLG